MPDSMLHTYGTSATQHNCVHSRLWLFPKLFAAYSCSHWQLATTVTIFRLITVMNLANGCATGSGLLRYCKVHFGLEVRSCTPGVASNFAVGQTVSHTMVLSSQVIGKYK